MATKRGSRLRALFDWSLYPIDADKQLTGYQTLGLFSSYRKISALLWLLTVPITLALAPLQPFTGVPALIFLAGLFLQVVGYLLLATFVFLGHRWALVLSMILWTFEKGIQIHEVAGGATPPQVATPQVLALLLFAPLSMGVGRLLGIVAWWYFYMSYFWKAFRVEQERRRRRALGATGIAGCHAAKRLSVRRRR